MATCAAVLVGLLVLESSSAAQKIKLATLAPKGSSIHDSLLQMGEEWKRESGGSLNMTVYPDGTQGGEADMVRRMRIGQLQAALVSVAGISEIDEGFSALQNVPLRYRSLEEVEFVRQRLSPELEARILEKGFVLLGSADVGWVRLFSKRPLLTPADFQKAKLFTWAGDEQQVSLMKRLGLTPVPLETAEILPGLQTGLIDTVGAAPFYALAGQFHTSAPHMLELDWAPLIGGIVLTKKAWEGVPAELQAKLRASAQRTSAAIRTINHAEGEAAIAAMEQHGLVRHRLTAEGLDQWRAYVEPLHPQLRGSIIPADLFDRVGVLLEEYRQARAPTTR